MNGKRLWSKCPNCGHVFPSDAAYQKHLGMKRVRVSKDYYHTVYTGDCQKAT